MNDLIIKQELWMDSREIAELTNKRHDNVIRDIETQLDDHLKFEAVYMGANREERKCYRLPHREIMILISGYSVELRTKIIDRWIELENKNKPTLPQTFAEALRLAADQAEQIETMKPKVLTYDKFLSSESWQSMNEVAHILGIGRNTLFSKLRNKNILMGNNTPYQKEMDKGYFKVIEKPIEMSGNVFNKPQTLVNAKGVEYISKLIAA
ncbi:MAG: hypothetical protein HGB12_00280 [Bacteroidetes bacterium]|nr:hypothetical protein [Bacteroidota bacterium]